jgi:transitional endoplasmic reticulum ATPase
MSFNDEILISLKQAVSATPENPHLHRHLADLLLAQGDIAAAESEYRAALALAPTHPQIRLGLAQTFYQGHKDSAGLALVEDLLAEPDPPAAAFVLCARLLERRQERVRALQLYQQGVQKDPSLADESLTALLNGALFPEGPPTLANTEPTVAPPEPEREAVKVPHHAFVEEQAPAIEKERPATTFADIGGMEALKEEIRLKIIHPLQHPELYQAYGKTIGGGILMYGPPGCGKTHLARATAGEVKADFISVGINEILDMWLGQSERNLHAIFEQARAAAPCVLFFDEVDALGASRSDLRQSAGRQLINQFLAEMDGLNASNEGVLILAATNAPWHLDNAFRRPGRFDRILFVPPPDGPGRTAILQLLLAQKPTENLDLNELARKTEGFSGADLKALIDIAIEGKLQEAIRTGIPGPISHKDLLQALKQARPTTREWFNTARNYVLYANQGGLYDEVKAWLKLP